MSSKASKFIVLCEGKLDKVVVCHFLKRGWNIHHRVIEIRRYPGGRGAGEQHVRQTYANELKAYRHRSAKASTVLVVILDADEDTVEGRRRALDQAARDAGIAPRSESEAVLHVIPKRHIETWLAWLDGISVDEETCYKNSHAFHGHEKQARPLVDRLAGMCRSQEPVSSSMPPSLRLACGEFSRVRERL